MKKTLIIILLLSSIFIYPVFSSDNYIVKEYRITNNDTKSFTDFYRKEKFQFIKKRRNIKSRNRYKKNIFNIKSYNSILNNYNYKLIELKPSNSEFSTKYNLFKNNNLILKNLSSIHSLNQNKDKNKFFFLAEQNLENGPPYVKFLMISNNQIKEWNSCWGGSPFYMKNNLYKIEFWRDGKNKPFYKITINDSTIFTFGGYSPVKGPIDKFYSYKNNWILEYTDKELEFVVINGKYLNQSNIIFNYTYFKDKPFYFYYKKPYYYISYGNKTLNLKFDKIIHKKCCMGAIHNIVSTQDYIGFFAKKNKKWYYIEIK